jgi:NADH pyrophosphatase NudC (nudix superfamily)
MFCPKCGEELTEVNGELKCEPGEMGLSPKMRRDLGECFVERSRAPKEMTLGFRVGSTWFCPGCGVRMEVEEGRVACPLCSSSLNEFIYELIELHPHRRDDATQARLDRWWAENRRKAPSWPRQSPEPEGQ